jgi:hypothetical protein
MGGGGLYFEKKVSWKIKKNKELLQKCKGRDKWTCEPSSDPTLEGKTFQSSYRVMGNAECREISIRSPKGKKSAVVMQENVFALRQ